MWLRVPRPASGKHMTVLSFVDTDCNHAGWWFEALSLEIAIPSCSNYAITSMQAKDPFSDKSTFGLVNYSVTWWWVVPLPVDDFRDYPHWNHLSFAKGHRPGRQSMTNLPGGFNRHICKFSFEGSQHQRHEP
jgi:hypothetical protein